MAREFWARLNVRSVSEDILWKVDGPPAPVRNAEAAAERNDRSARGLNMAPFPLPGKGR